MRPNDKTPKLTLCFPVRRTLPAAMGLVLAGGLAGCGAKPQAASPPPKPLAVVNGQAITESDWNNVVHATEFLDQTPVATDAASKKQQVNTLVQQTAVEQWALKNNVITQQSAQSQATSFINKNIVVAVGGQSAYQKALSSAKLTSAALQAFVTNQYILQNAFGKITQNIKQPTTATAQAYFASHQSQYATPTQVEVRHILVKTQSEAQSLLTQIQHGANFASLAQKYSTDTGSAKQGGSLGWVPEGAASGFVTGFYQEMDKLKPGQYGIAHTQYGYHIIEVQAIKAGSVPSFSSVQQQVVNQLWQQEKNTAFQTYASNLVKKAKVTIY